MGWKSIVSKGKKRVMAAGPVVRLMSDDRVMRVADAVFDAPVRLRGAAEKAAEAWQVLVHGYGLPEMDPSMTPDHVIATKAGKAMAAATEPKAKSSEPAASPERVGDAEVDADDEQKLADQMAARTSIAGQAGRDVFKKCYDFKAADNARRMGVYPYFRPLDFNDGPEAMLEGRRVLMLGSNNYLGLTTHPKVREAAMEAIRKYGTSMTGSRLVNGSMQLHREFEEKLAAFHGKEAALVLTTGYQVNLAALAALLSNRHTVALIDRSDHASIYDGVRLGVAVGARMVRYKHNDAESLDRQLASLEADAGALVITDGVFSTEGEIANLPDLVRVTKKHGARILVDDAHALGVVGPMGRGTAALFGVEQDVDLIGGTFSKSLASIGGWLVGERKVLDYIQHFASSFMFAASAAPPNVAAAMAALEVMQEESWRMDELRKNYTYMREELIKMGWDVGHSQTAVIPLYVRKDLRTIMMWKELLDNYAVYTNPFISPGVPPKQACLRTSYMATHTREHLDRALTAFHAVGKKFGILGS